MALSRLPLAGGATILLFLAMLFMFFVVLSGTSFIAPLNNTYFLEADTYFITGARPISRWTFWKICDDHQQNCGASVPAMPFGYAWSANALFVPPELIGSEGGNTTSRYYFYIWRFAWVFYLISMIFVIFAFLSGFLAFFGRLGAAVSAMITVTTLFFYTLAVSLMSATFVNARNAFTANRRNAHIGANAFGFSWASWICLILATGLLVVGTRKNESSTTRRRGARSKSPTSSHGDKKRSGEQYA